MQLRFPASLALMAFFCSCSEHDGNGVADDSTSSETAVVLSSSSNTIYSSSIIELSSSISGLGSSSSDGVCTSLCDAIVPADPVTNDSGGTGSITTYGSVGDPETSSGGACNYGQTGVYFYAAIHVNVVAGDGLGAWQGGHACGQCVEVRAQTLEGWKTTVVRIMDKCPDEYCGVDLGGAPAHDLMGIQAGRYQGEWKWVSCEGHPEVFDGDPSLYVKDGSNPDWAIVQVRNPLSAVDSIALTKEADSSRYALAWAIEAENFYKVPVAILHDSAYYAVNIWYKGGLANSTRLQGVDLAKAMESYPLQ